MSFRFGPLIIPQSQVFMVSRLSYGLVNLKPAVPGHVLVVSRRPVTRFNDLSADEVTDLFQQGQRVSRLVERVYKADSLTLVIQDGKEAGQSVPHVHLHILPRRKADFANNDDIYDELGSRKRVRGVDNDERVPRSAEEMAEEAELLRSELGEWSSDASTLSDGRAST
ncbi:HIT-like protein [Linderina pennispora]|uniref:Bis(5'-adenosyl)-triphosphatase n=1 Tax=Linderina pennispora TaxID=61395 RepID=A0A1Y1W837_9FUNG|nr:HIT-like protein [Linderina pennispora]ORX69700.1 HIT-like protein [Linderina pennispora]